MKKIVLTLGITLSVLIAASWQTMSNSGGPPVARTGGLGESNCASCHNNSLNTGAVNNILNLDSGTTEYIPGRRYTLTLTVVGPNPTNGFQLKVVNANNQQVGTLEASAGMRVTPNGGIQYLAHSTPLRNGENTWSFNWTPPANQTGDVTFYVATYNGVGQGSRSSIITTSSFRFTQGSIPVNVAENPKPTDFKVFKYFDRNAIQVQYNSSKEQPIKMKLFDLQGKLISNLYVGNSREGMNREVVSIPEGIAGGFYLVYLETRSGVVSRSVKL